MSYPPYRERLPHENEDEYSLKKAQHESAELEKIKNATDQSSEAPIDKFKRVFPQDKEPSEEGKTFDWGW